MSFKLLNVDQNAKTVKGGKKGYLTGILYLAPATEAKIKDEKGKIINLCPASSAGCRDTCLYKSGRALVYPKVIKARIRKTKELFKDTDKFLKALVKDIKTLERKAKKKDMIPVVRLNGTSDLNWQEFKLNGKTLYEIFPHLQFYDYTKRPDLFHIQPKNLHLTFSFSGSNIILSDKMLNRGINVAAVVTKENKEYLLQDKRNFIDGDVDDLRFKDPAGKIILLKAKGKARYDDTGFLVA